MPTSQMEMYTIMMLNQRTDISPCSYDIMWLASIVMLKAEVVISSGNKSIQTR